MKKMLVLALVLAVAGFANAGLLQDIKLSYDGNLVTVTGLVSGNAYGTSGFGLYVPAGSAGMVSEPVAAYVAAGDLGAITYQAAFNGVDVAPLWSGTTGTAQVVAGKWFTFKYVGSANDKLDVYDYAISAVTPVGQIAIPEPMTMAILALGGLFIRKK